MTLPAARTPRGVDAALAVVLAAIALGLWLSDHSLGYVHGNDSYDYAQMGRELASGHGFATRQIFPRHVPFYAENGYLEAEHWPNLHRYPLPTVVDALGTVVVGDPIRGAIAACGLAYVLSVPMLFALARRFTGPALAFGLALFFATDGPIRLSSYNGYTEALAILLMLAALSLVFRERLSARACLLAGALCGLAILNRYQSALLLPLVLGFAVLRSPEGVRARFGAAVVLAAVFVLLPWGLRDLSVVGQPFFSLSSTRSLLKGFGWDADMTLAVPIDLPSVLSQYGGDIAEKCADCLRDKATSLAEWEKMLRGPVYVGLLLVAFASLAWRSAQRDDFDLFKWGVALFVVANVFLQCVSVDHSRLYVPLRPLLLLLATLGVVQLLSRFVSEPGMTFARGAIAAVFVIVATREAVYGGFAAHRPEWGNQQAASIEGTVRGWCPFLEPDAIVVSDVSLRVTMYCGNRTIRLPTHTNDFLTIDRDYVPIDYLLLSPSAVGGVRRAGRRVPKAYVRSGFLESDEFLERFEPVLEFRRGALYRRR